MTNYYSKEPKSKYEILICVFREFREIGFTENVLKSISRNFFFLITHKSKDIYLFYLVFGWSSPTQTIELRRKIIFYL